MRKTCISCSATLSGDDETGELPLFLKKVSVSNSSRTKFRRGPQELFSYGAGHAGARFYSAAAITEIEAVVDDLRVVVTLLEREGTATVAV